jgi:hypothetical protein
VGPEFYAAFQVAKLALAGIRSCVDMLNEGKGELQAVTGDIKKGVESAQAIYKEVTGFWSWLQKLFGGSPASVLPSEPATPASVEAAPKSKPPDITEDDVVETFLTHFTDFVEAQTVILDAISDEREKILNVWNPKQNNRRAAIELIRYERRINDMAMELSGLMASAPKKLGSVREQFSEKLDEVRDAQSAARERFRIRKHQESWQRDLLRNHRIDRAMAMVWVAVVLLWIWATLLSVGWLVRTPDGLSLP